MKFWDEPSQSDWDRWEELVLDGIEPSTAARSITDAKGKPFTCTRFRQSSEQRHGEILRAGQEARAGYVDERVEVRALEHDAPPAVLLAWARRWNRAYSERTEVTGADGGPIELAVREARDQLAARLAAITERRAAPDDPGQPQ